MKWHMPSWREELGEFERVSQTLHVEIEILQSAFNSGEIMVMNEELWSLLENTDSWSISSMHEVRYHTHHSGRDEQRILEAFNRPDTSLPTPIIVCYEKDKYHLVAGNTRLMVCKALGELPSILMITITP